MGQIWGYSWAGRRVFPGNEAAGGQQVMGITSFAVLGCLWPLWGVPWRQRDAAWVPTTTLGSAPLLGSGHPIPLRGSESGWGTQKPAERRSICLPIQKWGCRLLWCPAQLAARMWVLLSPLQWPRVCSQGQRATSGPWASHEQALSEPQASRRDPAPGQGLWPGQQKGSKAKGRRGEGRGTGGGWAPNAKGTAVLVRAWLQGHVALSPVSPVSLWILLPSAGRTQSCSGPEFGRCAKAWGPHCDPTVLCPAPRHTGQCGTMHGSGLDTPRCPLSLPAASPRKPGSKTAHRIRTRYGRL